MKKHFYSHLVELNEITLDLAGVEMTKSERLHLLALLEANIHSVVINTVLSELNASEKKIFLANLVSSNYDKTWEHLDKLSENIEEKIKKSVDVLVIEMRKDIKNLKT